LAALERAEPSGRAAYLAEACGGDDDLRRRVEALLHRHEQAGSFLERAAVDPAETAGLDPAAGRADSIDHGPAAGAVVAGRYKLVGAVGEGGMGTVWLAEQTAPVRRKVALKVIKPGMDSKQVLARFEAERQALALMDHPNIAKVLDAGATETGRPYFVMELVRGIRITNYCDQNNLVMEQRLELFVQVCHAIQ